MHTYKITLSIKNSFYKYHSIEILNCNYVKNSLIIKDNYYLSLLNTDYKHLFYIIKCYLNNPGLICSIYFVLIDVKNEKKPEYLHRIIMNEISKMKSDLIFLDWWEKLVLKLSNYETEEKKIFLIIHLNINNIKQKFNVEEKNCIFLQPDPYLRLNLYKKKYLFKNTSLILLSSLLLNIILIICLFKVWVIY